MNYWEKFGAIAFDQSQKALLTSCCLKNPNDQSKDPTIKCCFSFAIRRDDHKMYVIIIVYPIEKACADLESSPSLIVGNFLPQDPVRH